MTRRRRARGYTLVESMAAVAVVAVGATGVVAMQKSVLIGNRNGKNLAVANAIAQTWAERLRVDAMAWNDPNGVADLAETRWLNGGFGQWFIPNEIVGIASPDADLMGADIFPGDTGPGPNNAPVSAFCTHVRLQRLYPQLIRAEIRVFWERGGTPLPDNCQNLDMNAVGSDSGRYGFVYVTTGIIQNATP